MDLPISGLPNASSLTGAELFAVVQGGQTRQSTGSALLTYIAGGLTAVNGLTKSGTQFSFGGALTGNTSLTGSYTLNFANDFVGINTATQSGYSERLRVNGPSRFDDTTYISDQGYFTWSPGTSFSVVATSQHLYLAAAGVKDIVFLNNGGESARIFSDNNVSIGYGVSASAKLQVAGSTTDSSTYAFKVFDSALSQIIGVRNDGYTYFSRLTASTVPYIDASNRLVSSAVTPTELGLLSGLTGFTGTGTLLAKGTSPVFTTDITTPLIIGGSAVGSQLNLKGTSGNGTSTVAAINFLVGNNGATTAGSIYNSGQVNIGNYASPTNLRIFTVGQDTAYMSFGSVVGSTSYSAIYFNQGTPSGTNYTLAGDASSTFLNAATNLYHRIGATNMIAITSATQIFTPNSVSSGTAVNFTFTGSANTGQTASTEINRFLLTTSSRQWNTGAITTQREVYITSPTYSFVGASTITSAYTLYVEAPTASTNATITNNYALGLSGDLSLLGGNRLIRGSNAITLDCGSGSGINMFVNGASYFSITANNLTVGDATNFVLNTTTGTKIGTGTTQKIGFWNATPIVQPTTAVAASTLTSNGGTTLTSTDTIDGYTLLQVVKALRNTGIIA